MTKRENENERCQQLKTAYAPSTYKRILYLSDILSDQNKLSTN